MILDIGYTKHSYSKAFQHYVEQNLSDYFDNDYITFKVREKNGSNETAESTASLVGGLIVGISCICFACCLAACACGNDKEKI